MLRDFFIIPLAFVDLGLAVITLGVFFVNGLSETVIALLLGNIALTAFVGSGFLVAYLDDKKEAKKQ
jgi:hypothetical protein